ncbi:MAG TPA: M20 family metallo-hydrolase [Verrucomicrobiae bacterium]|nr:M20 family metallo-hydrolase [Verrucomicrobiae bacterium]
MALTIDSERLSRELDQLAEFSDTAAPAVTRVVYSEQDRRARAFLKGLFRDAGLEVLEDAIGNTFARWPGSDPDLPAAATGSHIDAVPNGGKYDGTVGVLGGLEAIRALQSSGFRPRRSIELIVFTAEEPTRFGPGCFGSRVATGAMVDWQAGRLVDKDGKTLDQWRQEAGFEGPLESVAWPEGRYASFVELHIEQGTELERAGVPLGIVTAIAAPACFRVTVEGEGGHAGTVPMPARRDALCAAAAIVLEVEKAARTAGAEESVATVGAFDVFPGAANGIPSRVRLQIDIRDTDRARRDQLMNQIMTACRDCAIGRKLTVRAEPICMDAPAECSPEITATLARAAGTHGLAWRHLASRACHDTLFMTRVARSGMLFIPCRGGVSHRPDEYAAPEAIANGALVLAEALAELSA